MKINKHRILVIVAILAVIAYVSFFVKHISDRVNEEREKTNKYERMQFVKDSLTVEALKRKLIDSSEYSEDKISDDDFKETIKP